MIAAILAFIQALPAITGGVNNFVNKYYDAKVQLMTARVSGDVELAKALVAGVVDEGKVRVTFLQTVAQSPFLQFLVAIFSIPVAVYNAKVIVWDTMLGLGSTPAIHGDVSTYMNIVVTGIFGTTGVMALGAVVDRWRKL